MPYLHTRKGAPAAPEAVAEGVSMKQYTIYFEGGLVVSADHHEMMDDALVFFDEQGQETMRIPADAIDTYIIHED